jgi:hypothetical protein
MKPLFHVSVRGGKSIDDLDFFSDRLEHNWQTLPTASGKSVYAGDALSPYLSTQRTFGWGASRAFWSCGCYLGIGLILQQGFDKPLLGAVGILFYAVAAALLIYGITKLKREEWLYINRKDGAPLVTLFVKGIEGWSAEEFRQKFEAYVRNGGSVPNHPSI